MPFDRNKFIVASAGSRKTTLLVESALAICGEEVLITTFTNENVEQVNAYLIAKNGCIPTNVTVKSWYSFLLQDGVRPYQNTLTERRRVRSILFEELPARAKFTKKNDTDNYFLTRGNDIYRDRAAEFVCQCDDRSGGLIIERLEKIFAHILIDEFQDFAGYDLEIVLKLLSSSISVIAACDPRQATFSTNNARKNQKFKRGGIADWIRKQEASKLLSVQEYTKCYRCNQAICDFADALFPDLPKTISMNGEMTGHDGVFTIPSNEVLNYVKKYNPAVLRYNVKYSTLGLPAINIGLSKGRTYDRVLVFPTKKMLDYVKTKDISKAGDLYKLYVAVTRAKYSVAFAT